MIEQMTDSRTGVIGIAVWLLIGLCGALISPASAAEQVLAPAGHQFSIVFAPNPKAERSSAPGSQTVLWTGIDDKILYIASHEASTVPYDTDNELAADVKNYIAAVGGTIIMQHEETRPTRHGPAKARRVVFKTAKNQFGEVMFVIDGTQTYSAAAIDMGTLPRRARYHAIVDSLKILN